MKVAGGHIVSDNGIKLITKPTRTDSGDILAIGKPFEENLLNWMQVEIFPCKLEQIQLV